MLIIDNFRTGKLTSARAPANTCLVVCLAELEHQNLFVSIGPFLGLVTKLCTLVLELCRARHSNSDHTRISLLSDT